MHQDSIFREMSCIRTTHFRRWMGITIREQVKSSEEVARMCKPAITLEIPPIATTVAFMTTLWAFVVAVAIQTSMQMEFVTMWIHA